MKLFIEAHNGALFSFAYTNYRNVREDRSVVLDASSIRYGTADYHPESAWLVDGFDMVRQDKRTFDLAKIENICVVEEHG